MSCKHTFCPFASIESSLIWRFLSSFRVSRACKLHTVTGRSGDDLMLMIMFIFMLHRILYHHISFIMQVIFISFTTDHLSFSPEISFGTKKKLSIINGCLHLLFGCGRKNWDEDNLWHFMQEKLNCEDVHNHSQEGKWSDHIQETVCPILNLFFGKSKLLPTWEREEICSGGDKNWWKKGKKLQIAALNWEMRGRDDVFCIFKFSQGSCMLFIISSLFLFLLPVT